jgi:hypothetical protein
MADEYEGRDAAATEFEPVAKNRSTTAAATAELLGEDGRPA